MKKQDVIMDDNTGFPLIDDLAKRLNEGTIKAFETPISIDDAQYIVSECKSSNIDPQKVVAFMKNYAKEYDTDGWPEAANATRESIQQIARVLGL